MTPQATAMTICRLVTITSLPTTVVEVEWPCAIVIHASQEAFVTKRPTAASLVKGLWHPPTKVIWIPDDDYDLQLCW